MLIVMEQTGVEIPLSKMPTVYLAGMDDECRKKAFEIATKLRRAGIIAEIDYMERSVKAQFKYADKIHAKFVAVIGGNELLDGVMSVKNMSTGESEKVAFENATAYFQDK